MRDLHELQGNKCRERVKQRENAQRRSARVPGGAAPSATAAGGRAALLRQVRPRELRQLPRPLRRRRPRCAPPPRARPLRVGPLQVLDRRGGGGPPRGALPQPWHALSVGSWAHAHQVFDVTRLTRHDSSVELFYFRGCLLFVPPFSFM